MIKTLGYLEIEELRYTQPIPLLLAVYLAHNKRACRREQLIQLFWPNAGCVNNINRQLKCMSQHLYERFEATNNYVVVFHYDQLCDVIGLDPFEEFGYVIEQLRPLNKKLRALGFISKYSYNLDNQQVTIKYEITEKLEPLKIYNHDRAKHNLRVALCNLRKHIDVEGLEKLSVVETTDAQVVMQAIRQGDFDTALDLYEGHFLEGVEEKLEIKNFNLSSDLETWIVSERQKLAWAMQRVLLAKALQAKEADQFVQMAQLAKQAINFYSSFPSKDFMNACADLIDLAHQKEIDTSEALLSLNSLPINDAINSKPKFEIRG